MKNLDPAALAALEALADEKGFERAAVRLSITQSAVSQRLRALEAEVGQRLVVRARPLRFTEAGRVLLRFARQYAAMRADAAKELGVALDKGARLPIAVNADSLATWVLPALDPLVQAGVSFELRVDDQDFTHDSLREGDVLGCVSTVRQALKGCSVTPLGEMSYVAVAQPALLAGLGAAGLNRSNFSKVPFLVFNRKDDMQQQWVSRAFGVSKPSLLERYVPSSEAYARAAMMGWGVGVLPELLVREALASGQLVAVLPQVRVQVSLYWHQWRLGGVPVVPGIAVPALTRVGEALRAYALGSLEQGSA